MVREYLPGGPGRRRWEFMRMPGDTSSACSLTSPAGTWAVRGPFACGARRVAVREDGLRMIIRSHQRTKVTNEGRDGQLARGRRWGIDIARLRRSLAGLPLPRAADGRLMLASLQSCQPSDHHGRNTRRSASYVPFGNPTRSCGCRKPMPLGDIHESRLRRGHAAGPGNGPGR